MNLPDLHDLASLIGFAFTCAFAVGFVIQIGACLCR